MRCESRKSAKTLFVYGSDQPLKTLGTFTADIVSHANEAKLRADFVVVEGDGRTLIG